VSGEATAGVVHLHPQAGEDWRSWPDAKAVREQLRLTAQQLLMYLRRGAVVQYRCPDSSLRFSPAEVDMLRLRIEAGTVAETQDLREANVELKDVLKHLCSALKQTQDHNEKLFGLITAPIDKGTAFVCSIVEKQNTRLEHLEATYDAAIQTREQLLSLAHERTLREQKAIAFQENVKHGIDRVASAIGPIAQEALKNLGVPGLGARHPVFDLVESLGKDPQMLLLLYSAPGVLSPEQKDMLRQIWPDLPWPTAAAPEPAPTAPAPAAPPTPPEPAPPETPRTWPPAAPATEPFPPPEASGEQPRRRRRRPTEGDSPP
jgi:hypothetical protein